MSRQRCGFTLLELCVTLAVIAILLVLCPPWIRTYHAGTKQSERAIGHYLIVSPPSVGVDDDDALGVKVDVPRWLTPIAVTGLVTGIASLVLRDSKR